MVTFHEEKQWNATPVSHGIVPQSWLTCMSVIPRVAVLETLMPDTAVDMEGIKK